MRMGRAPPLGDHFACLQGKDVTAVAAAKRHTLVLTAAGEVYTWGHRGVSPRRVNLAGAPWLNVVAAALL